MIDEDKLIRDLVANTHKERFKNYKTGSKDIYYLMQDVFDCIDRQTRSDGWIPCSDGKNLPEEKINPITDDFYEYQVTFQLGDVSDIRHYKFGNGHWWNAGQIMDRYVTAWRVPLEAYHA